MPKIARMLEPGLDARDLTSVLVPVERALERRVRDEDFLPVRDDLARSVPRMPVRVVADSLRSAFNVGGLFRSGECFGIEELVLSGYCADPEDANVRKAALGTDAHVPWRRVRRIADEAAACRDEARLVIALESEAEHSIDELEVSQPCALFIGNERHGLPSSFLDSADVRARVPLVGRKNSLNVVAATAVALAALRRQHESASATISIELDQVQRRMIRAAIRELGGASAHAVRAISRIAGMDDPKAMRLAHALDVEQADVELPERAWRQAFDLIHAVIHGLGDMELKACTGFFVRDYLALGRAISAACWEAFPDGSKDR